MRTLLDAAAAPATSGPSNPAACGSRLAAKFEQRKLIKSNSARLSAPVELQVVLRNPTMQKGFNGFRCEGLFGRTMSFGR